MIFAAAVNEPADAAVAGADWPAGAMTSGHGSALLHEGDVDEKGKRRPSVMKKFITKMNKFIRTGASCAPDRMAPPPVLL
jgi:hypothetical protein